MLFIQMSVHNPKATKSDYSSKEGIIKIYASSLKSDFCRKELESIYENIATQKLETKHGNVEQLYSRMTLGKNNKTQ